jgi:predicted nucleotidyltransferase
MRLTTTELTAIRTTLGALDPLANIYLYGSRTDDARRGGDIDIFMEATKAVDLRTALATQYRLSGACDVHVDLLIKSPDQQEMPIHQIARKGIRL